MSISDAAELLLLDYVGTNATWIKLHTGDPGEAGTANAATETTRKQVTWAAAASGSKAATGSPVATWTNVAATETYSHWSLWSASTAGTCYWTGALASSVSMSATEKFELSSLSLTLD
jgi:hypothetical protein